MKKHVRLLGFDVVAVLALAVIGYFGGGGEDAANEAVLDEAALGEDFGQDPVMASIDQALGRQPSTEVDKQLPSAGSAPEAAIAPAPGGSVASPSRQSEAGGGVPPSDGLASVDDRKIVQTSSIRLRVDDVGGGFEEVGRIATGAGGFVASSNFSLQGEHQVANITIRVPAGRYQQVLSDVRALGAKVEGETSNASDVSEEYSDLSARIRGLEATETQLLQLLTQADTVSEILQVQDRIDDVRGEIERVKGRIALLDKLSDMATITVQLRPVAALAKSDSTGLNLREEVDQAWEHSLEFLGNIAAGVVSVVVFSWWLIPLAVPAAIIGQRWARGRSAAKPATSD
jgi:hypothetical protein